jgi:hypothetical protein
VISVPLLREAFSAYQKNHGRLMPFRPEPEELTAAIPEPMNFEDLSDTELEDLKNRSLQTRAAALRRR